MLLWIMMICDVMTIMKKDDSSNTFPRNISQNEIWRKWNLENADIFIGILGLVIQFGVPYPKPRIGNSELEFRMRVSVRCDKVAFYARIVGFVPVGVQGKDWPQF
jgi:hypothetical protein